MSRQAVAPSIRFATRRISAGHYSISDHDRLWEIFDQGNGEWVVYEIIGAGDERVDREIVRRRTLRDASSYIKQYG